MHPVTPADLHHLLDIFHDDAMELLTLDSIQAMSMVMLTKREVVRHLAAIGRGVPVETVKPNGLAYIAAAATLSATARAPWAVDLAEIIIERLCPPTPAQRRHLSLVGGNNQ